MEQKRRIPNYKRSLSVQKPPYIDIKSKSGKENQLFGKNLVFCVASVVVLSWRGVLGYKVLIETKNDALAMLERILIFLLEQFVSRVVNQVLAAFDVGKQLLVKSV